MKSNIAIEVVDLVKTYSLRVPSTDGVNEFRALDGVSFTIEKGQSVAIIGSNGSGKSTLLKILAGVTKPTSGRVTISGRVASILDVGAGFHPELSGRENILVNGQLLGFSKKEITPKINDIIEFSGIGHFIDEPVKNYSNGMFLRLAFSIVVHLDFDVYLFDEVLGVGDAEFQLKFRSKLLNLQSDSTKTLIIVTHQIHEYRQFFNNFIFLENGTISTSNDLEAYYLKGRDTTSLSTTLPSSIFFDNLIIKSENAKKDKFKWEEPIDLFIDIGLIKKVCFIGISVKNSFNETTFESYFSKELVVGGSYKCRYQIPAFTFNSGTYFVDLIFSDLMSNLKIFSNVFVFSIDYKPKNWELNKKAFGSVKPNTTLKWL